MSRRVFDARPLRRQVYTVTFPAYAGGTHCAHSRRDGQAELIWVGQVYVIPAKRLRRVCFARVLRHIFALNLNGIDHRAVVPRQTRPVKNEQMLSPYYLLTTRVHRNSQNRTQLTQPPIVTHIKSCTRSPPSTAGRGGKNRERFFRSAARNTNSTAPHRVRQKTSRPLVASAISCR